MIEIEIIKNIGEMLKSDLPEKVKEDKIKEAIKNKINLLNKVVCK